MQARQVGGGYYDFLDMGPGAMGIVLADISGKGISGALLIANLPAYLRSQYAVALDDLPRLLRSAYRLFYENTNDESYATMSFAVYEDVGRDPDHRRMFALPVASPMSQGGTPIRSIGENLYPRECGYAMLASDENDQQIQVLVADSNQTQCQLLTSALRRQRWMTVRSCGSKLVDCLDALQSAPANVMV